MNYGFELLMIILVVFASSLYISNSGLISIIACSRKQKALHKMKLSITNTNITNISTISFTLYNENVRMY